MKCTRVLWRMFGTNVALKVLTLPSDPELRVKTRPSWMLFCCVIAKEQVSRLQHKQVHTHCALQAQRPG